MKSRKPHGPRAVEVVIINGERMVKTPADDYITEVQWKELATEHVPPLPTAVRPVNWRFWRHESIGELWRVVAVSLNLSPDGIERLQDARELFSKNFRVRLRESVKELGKRLPIVEFARWSRARSKGELARQIMAGPPSAEHHVIHLTAFADLADEMGWELPPLFPRMPKFIGTSDRERDARNLKLANEKRRGDAESLRDVVVELDRVHPEWSHAQMARELADRKIGHYRSGKPYSARRIGQIRKFGRKFPTKG